LLEGLFILLKEASCRLFRKIRIDRAVLWGILTRLWSILAGAVTLLIIAYKFSPQLQGYYYTFFSIIAFQFLVELGLSNIIVQFASHEWSGLSFDKTGKIVGERDALSRLQSLAQMFFRWYCFASIVLTLGLGICGFLVLSSNQDAHVKWILPWFSLCICNGAVFCLLPIWSLLEGSNQILKLYSYRFIQAIVLNLSLWIAMLSGAALWAVPISNIAILICAAVFLSYKCRTFLSIILFSVPAGPRINWYQEILPLQWRTTITWLIGPLALNLFVPVLFRYHGSVIAGQMGMTLYLVSVVATMPSSWLNPMIPQFGMLIAKKKYKELDRLFWRTAEIFTTIAILAAVMAWFLVYTLNQMNHSLAGRFLPLLPTGIFILAQIVLVITVPFSTYLRIHKKEPLLYVAVIGGILIGSSTVILGRYYSAMGMGLGYLSVSLILVPITFIIWHRCRIEWHKDDYIERTDLNNYITTGGIV
jgi:O-antigen/teichoic acid export membrane protein